MEFDRRMAIALKADQYHFETNTDGEVVIMPKTNKDLYATIDPEKNEAHYWQNFPEAVRASYVPVKELDDLRYFVELLTEDD